MQPLARVVRGGREFDEAPVQRLGRTVDRLSFGLAPFKKKTNINKTVPYTPAPCEPGSFQCDRKSNAKIMTVWYKTCRHHTNFHCWYDRHTLSLKSSLCGVNELCFGTKQVRLGVITFDECKHAP
jgi:hypothetical protein